MSFSRPAPQPRRYTRLVGNSRMRAVAIVLVAVLGGGPAEAAVCEALCLGGHETTSVATTPVTHEGHAGAAHQGPAPSEHAAAHHHLDQSAEAEPGSSGPSRGDVPALVNTLSHAACCPEPAQARASTAAGRADTRVLPALHAAVLSSGTGAGLLDPELASLTRRAPPGDASPARTAFVLRI